LSTNDWFEEAQEAYKKAWRPDMAIRIVGFLAQNAINEKRFNDAAQYMFMQATEYLSLVEKPEYPSAGDYKNIK